MPDERASSVPTSRKRGRMHPKHSRRGGILRSSNRYLTEVTDRDGLLRHAMNLPRCAVVPMHSHPDGETFYVISGHPTPGRFPERHWKTLGPGDVIDAQDGIKHAWRNPSETAASILCVTTMRVARFLRGVAVDAGSADSSA